MNSISRFQFSEFNVLFLRPLYINIFSLTPLLTLFSFCSPFVLFVCPLVLCNNLHSCDIHLWPQLEYFGSPGGISGPQLRKCGRIILWMLLDQQFSFNGDLMYNQLHQVGLLLSSDTQSLVPMPAMSIAPGVLK